MVAGSSNSVGEVRIVPRLPQFERRLLGDFVGVERCGRRFELIASQQSQIRGLF